MEEMDKKRRLARRRMAWICFTMMMAESVALLAGLFLGGPLFAANATAISPILIGLFFSQATVIGAYLGVSMAEAMKRDPH